MRDKIHNPDAFACASTIKSQEGMSLRDYFAAAALQGLLANPKLQAKILEQGGAYGGWIEESAYGWADAMLRVRLV